MTAQMGGEINSVKEQSAIVRFLSSPAAFDHDAGGVDVVETHMSWVFMGLDRVFKMKKPLRTQFLDFSTLSAREIYCKEEVRLNRRLAPDIYLRAAHVCKTDDGEFSICGEGEIVEWLVEMRRLPSERMLDRALSEHSASSDDLGLMLDHLFSFLSGAPPVEIERERYLATLRRQHAESGRVLVARPPILLRRKVLQVMETLRRVIETEPDWLLEPLARRRIIEGHGDLRPEHICLTNPPAIIDCIEFNADLRLLDPFDELGYLALECQLLGASEFAGEILNRYVEFIGYEPPRVLLDFYAAYRAIIRARLSVAHIFDWPRTNIAHWARQGDAYLCAADTACLRLRRRLVR